MKQLCQILLLLLLAQKTVAQSPISPASACATLCNAAGSSIPDCQQRCLDLLDKRDGNPCRIALMDLQDNPARAEALAFSSGHIAEAVLLLQQAANGSTDAANFLPYLNDVGYYDACQAVDSAHYCLASPAAAASPLPLRLGACLPDTCDQTSVNALFNSSNTVALTCGARRYSISAGAAVTIALFSSLGLLIVAATALEYVQSKNNSRGHSSSSSSTDLSKPVTPTTEEHDEESIAMSAHKIDDSTLRAPLLLPPATGAADSSSAHYGKQQQQQRSLPVRLLLCFSVLRNSSALWSLERRPDAFAVLDGIRTLSMQWVILGHTLVFCIVGAGFSNLLTLIPQDGEGVLARFSSQAILSGFLAVDTFFFLSGFLLAYVLLTKLEYAGSTSSSSSSSSSAKLLGQLYAMRWLRLTPTYAAAVLFYWQLLPLLGQGPSWGGFDMDCKACSRYWWTNLLYINNLVPWRSSFFICFPVSWYLANDFQFFVLGAPLILLYRKRPRVVWAVLAAALVASCSVSLWLGLAHNIRFTLFDGGAPIPGVQSEQAAGQYEYFSDYYLRPWTRCPPYIIGLGSALLWYTHFSRPAAATAITNSSSSSGRGAHKENRQDQYSSVCFTPAGVAALTSAWVVLLGTTAYGTYFAYQDVPSPISKAENALYLAFAKPAWALGLAALCFQCFAGRGGAVQWLLQLPIFIPLSRLTFCAYLVHPSLLNWYFRGGVEPFRYSNLSYAVTYMGAVVGTYLGSIALHLAVEAPVKRLEWEIRHVNRTVRRHH